jgi:hypothetical protein
MSALDDLLDAYEDVAKAARRLERSRSSHAGAHEFCCEKGRCLICEEAYIRAEADLHRALAKLAPLPFRSEGDQVLKQGDERLGPRIESESGPDPRSQREISNRGSGPTEYLRQFFTELEKVKARQSFDVSHAIDFRDEQLYVSETFGRGYVSTPWTKIHRMLPSMFFSYGRPRLILTKISSRWLSNRRPAGQLYDTSTIGSVKEVYVSNHD